TCAGRSPASHIIRAGKLHLLQFRAIIIASHHTYAERAQADSLSLGSTAMTSIRTDYDSARAALTRMIPLAMSDTGQARRVANFLMAWWNGPDLGHFEIADLFGLDIAIANDITSVIGFLGQNDRGAVYIDSLGFGEEMQDIIALWRPSAARET
ncbi:hypothetical protein ACUXPF_003685, partial [Sphingomonas sanguinis]